MPRKAVDPNTPRRLSDYMSPEEARPPIHGVDEFLGQELILVAAEHQHGNYGEYLLLTCSLEGSDEIFLISTGSMPVMRQVNAVKPRELPLPIRFERAGKGYVIL